VGAITSPVSAVLRCGNTVAAGISATATRIEGKEKTKGRYRFPRYFGIENLLKEYEEDSALA